MLRRIRKWRCSVRSSFSWMDRSISRRDRRSRRACKILRSCRRAWMTQSNKSTKVCFPDSSLARRNSSAAEGANCTGGLAMEGCDEHLSKILFEEWRHCHAGNGGASRFPAARGGCDRGAGKEKNGGAVSARRDGWTERRRPIRRAKLLSVSTHHRDSSAEPRRPERRD